MCGVLGWLQWPSRPPRRTSRCPRRRCRSRCPASCLPSEGVLHTPPGLLGPLPHPCWGCRDCAPALDPHQTSASCSITWSEGPMAPTQADAGDVVASSVGPLQAVPLGLWPWGGGGTRWAGEATQRVSHPGDVCPAVHLTLLSRLHPRAEDCMRTLGPRFQLTWRIFPVTERLT